MKLYLQMSIKSSFKEVAIRSFLLFSYPSFTFRSAANKGFGKVGFGNKPSAFVILLSFCTLAVLNTKDTAKARQKEFYFPTFPKPRTLAANLSTLFFSSLYKILIQFSTIAFSSILPII
jgi:hypothetical protein